MEDLGKILENYLRYFRSKDKNMANINDKYMGISSVLRTKVVDNWLATQKENLLENQKNIYYISLEYNLGSPIKMHISSAGLEKEFDYLKKYVKLSEDEILGKESSIELGNSLQGDFTGNILETFVSKSVPSVAYGLWYGLGQFKQSINTSEQVEIPYYWASLPHPWAIEDPGYRHSIYFGGRIFEEETEDEKKKYAWHFDDVITATPFDYPISGYRNKFVNTLRFWNASPSSAFNSDYLYHNDYVRACDDKMKSVKFLGYLFNDEAFRQTSELHIKQQYFLASSSIKDIIYRHTVLQKNSIRTIYKKAKIFLADCRCGLAIVEFVRILSYEHDIPFEEACAIAQKIFVVSMPVSDSMEFQNIPFYIFEAMLPFHAKVILDMNHLVLEKAREKHNISDHEAEEISLIEEGAMKKVRMANLFLLFSREIFTYSEQDVKYIKDLVCPNTERVFDVEIKPSLSAVSIRRWLVYTNKNLTKLISSKIGSDWITENAKLSAFEKFAANVSVQDEFERIKLIAKEKFFRSIGIEFAHDFLSEALFISHSRKITMANSQILMLFYIACRYVRLEEGENFIPRVYLFAGRAAPADFYGKQLVALINIFVLALQNHPKLQVHFTRNRNVSTDEKLLSAGDLSEYISSPMTIETSGYNIFRAAANGVIILTGTNKSEIQVAEKLGDKTTFSFGNPNADINSYDVNSAIERNPILNKAFELVYRWIKDYSGGEEEERKIYPFLHNLRSRDEMKMFLHFDEYCRIQDEIDDVFRNRPEWCSMALRNIARARVGSIDDTLSSLFFSGKTNGNKK